MKSRVIVSILICTLAALSAGSTTSVAATASSSTAAAVIAPLTITNTLPLNFGAVVSGGTSGTVVVTPASVRSATGGAVLGPAGASSAAAFLVTGDASATYSITLPSSITVSDGGSGSMTVDTFTSNPSGTGTLSIIGTQVLQVGATLHVGANQTTGAYTGTFDVTVAYN